MIYDNSDRGLYQSAYNSGYSKGKQETIDIITEKYFDAIENILHEKDLELSLNQALSIYARILNKCDEIAEQLK